MGFFSIAVTYLLYPIFWILWEVAYAPIRLVFGFSSLLGFLCTSIYEVIMDSWLFVSSIVRVTSQVETTVTSSAVSVSIWRSLWNDLFSQVAHLCPFDPSMRIIESSCAYTFLPSFDFYRFSKLFEVFSMVLLPFSQPATDTG